MKIQMVDLYGQYEKIKDEIDSAVLKVLRTTNFINGPEVSNFKRNLENYLKVKHVTPCANGTDALQIAMMALGLQPGDEVIVPAFSYIATAEVIALLGLVPKWVEINPDTFNIDPIAFESVITNKTKAVVPVHLYGQCANMEELIKIATKNNIYLIEDTAQSIGASYTFSNGQMKSSGTIGDIGCTSFFPSKNLGCFGDGGALFTNNDELAKKIQMIANHGQQMKYKHDLVGVNSRLDTIQAAVLDVKLKYLDCYTAARQSAALVYDELLEDVPQLQTPFRDLKSTHVYHQYTLKVKDGSRDALKEHLEKNGIPTMIYYPIPMHLQKAYYSDSYPQGSFPISERISKEVISLPMHTELTNDSQKNICFLIKSFYGINPK